MGLELVQIQVKVSDVCITERYHIYFYFFGSLSIHISEAKPARLGDDTEGIVNQEFKLSTTHFQLK